MSQTHIPDIGARQLAAVLAVAEYRSFIAAATALQTSQPALTRTIKRVEDVLGVQLFERTTRQVRITDAGREFVAVAQRIADDLRITVGSMRELAEQQRGQVILSSIMSVANGPLPSVIAAYRQAHPGIEVRIRDGIHGAVNEDVRSGVADFGINYLESTPEALVATPLGRDVFGLVVRRDHVLARDGRRGVSLGELADLPLVSMPADSQTRRVLDAAAAAAGLRLDHGVVVSQITTMLNFVRAGAGVGFAPSAAMAQALGPDLVRLAVHEPEIALDMGIVRLRDRDVSPAAAGLMHAITAAWPKY